MAHRRLVVLASALGALGAACGGPLAPEVTSTDALSGRPAIELLHARARTIDLGSAVLIGTIRGAIDVADLAYDKAVFVHYTTDGATWQDQAASYVGSLGDGRQRWDFELELFSVDHADRAEVQATNVQFALRCEVAGETFWDNNGHHDYRVSGFGQRPAHARAVLGRTPVLLTQARASVEPWPAYANRWSYEVVVKNLDPHKAVSIVWTPDGWTNTYSAPLSYTGPSSNHGDEIWQGAALVAKSATELEFAVVMDAAGRSLWDNREGRNYVLRIPGELGL